MRLYKYYNLTKGLAALSGSRLYFTPPKYFNDPFEFAPAMARPLTDTEIASHMKTRRHRKVVREALTSIGVYKGSELAFPKWFAANFGTLFPILKERFRGAALEIESTFNEIISRAAVVSSLSDTPTNLLMWSHYADSHKGIVVGYELSQSLFPKKSTLAPVEYSKDRVAVEPLFFAATSPYGVEMNKTILTKGIDWKYEGEHRVIVPLSLCETEIDNNRTLYFINLPKPATVRVVLGVRASDADVSGVRGAVAQYPGATIEKAVLSRSNFDLEIKPL